MGGDVGAEQPDDRTALGARQEELVGFEARNDHVGLEDVPVGEALAQRTDVAGEVRPRARRGVDGGRSHRVAARPHLGWLAEEVLESLCHVERVLPVRPCEVEHGEQRPPQPCGPCDLEETEELEQVAAHLRVEGVEGGGEGAHVGMGGHVRQELVKALIGCEELGDLGREAQLELAALSVLLERAHKVGTEARGRRPPRAARRGESHRDVRDACLESALALAKLRVRQWRGRRGGGTAAESGRGWRQRRVGRDGRRRRGGIGALGKLGEGRGRVDEPARVEVQSRQQCARGERALDHWPLRGGRRGEELLEAGELLRGSQL